MAALVKKSLVDQIYEQLREDIITQKIGWGERLNVSDLQERFEISCTPIREAINRLQKEGLVEYKNNVGASVIEISESDVAEIQQVASVLDYAAIRYAMKAGDHKKMAEELAVQIKNYQHAKDEMTRSRCIEQFTEVFYKYAGNTRLVAMAQLIKGQQSMLRSTYGKEKKGHSNMDDHIKIYNAVLSVDADAAVKAMEKNYKKGTETLLQSFSKKQAI
jgi:DNA-binding GntR family transcriptional regulator